jgi:hypothetical protein
MNAKFKKGEKVNFKSGSVSKKYGCRFGTIIEIVDIYTDGNLKYPAGKYDLRQDHCLKVALNLSTNTDFGEFYCKGYVINACNVNGIIKEKITVTEDFILKTI